jgi:hypothetical protein
MIHEVTKTGKWRRIRTSMGLYQVQRIAASEYRAASPRRMFDFDGVDFATMKKLFGNPHGYKHPEFPDDDEKVAVCWGLWAMGNIIKIRDYKNGENRNPNNRIKDNKFWIIECDHDNEFYIYSLLNLARDAEKVTA